LNLWADLSRGPPTFHALLFVYSYNAFGRTIESDINLPELPVVNSSGGSAPDLRIANIGAVRRHSQYGQFEATVREETVVLRWGYFGEICVSRTLGIRYRPWENLDEEAVRTYVGSVPLGVWLHLDGRLTLHGSTVVLDDEAYTIVGHKRAGKSSLTAYLCSIGGKLLADDISVIDFDAAGNAIVLPGAQRLKLWPDTAMRLFPDQYAGWPRIHGESEKLVFFPPKQAVQADAVPLRAVLVIEAADVKKPSSYVNSAQDAFRQIVAHSYALRFLQNAGLSLAHHVRTCRLASIASVQTLYRTSNFDDLPDLASILLDGSIVK
jgi:hypothetical protein